MVARAPLLLAVILLALGGCSVGSDERPPAPSAPTETGAPAATAPGVSPPAPAAPASPPAATATRNTTRLGGASAVADSAATARAAFPGERAAGRPSAVVLVDAADWQGGIAASVLAGAPARAPVLATSGGALPPETLAALAALRPGGVPALRGLQVIRLGAGVPAPPGLRSRVVDPGGPYERAAAVDRLSSVLARRPSRAVVVVSGERPEWAMPAAAWAARSGDGVLFTSRSRVPRATLERLRARPRPAIFVLGPEEVIGRRVERTLRRLGTVRRVSGATPVENAIAFARYERGPFGWGVVVPGYNLTVASTARPFDAAAAAALATNGVFAPLLLTDRPDRVPRALENYLLDVQPGYEGDPSEAVYNRIWLLGDASAVSAQAQARLDELAALVPVGP